LSKNHDRNRRGFLRATLGAGITGATFTGFSQSSAVSERNSQDADAAQVARVTLDREIYDCGAILSGEIHFVRPPTSPIQVQWIDSLGRISGELTLPVPATLATPVRFSFHLGAALAYSNWIRVKVGDVPQFAAKNFLLSPAPEPWEDYHVISWAHYRDGYYDRLREAGIDATIVVRDASASHVLDNNVRFYVEQMAADVFSIYINKRDHWYGVVNKFATDRENLSLWVRDPCINDPKTEEYLRERLTRYVRSQKAFRPLYYNIADELGEGWQIKANDFCHSQFCTAKFAESLRRMYGTPARVGQEWGVGEFAHWDDGGSADDEEQLMIDCTTTDRAFDVVAVARLEAAYGSMARLNQDWGTSFPEPQDREKSLRSRWEPAMAAIRELRTVEKLEEASLAQKLEGLDNANERWGTKFRTWAEVIAFVNRFYTELSKIRSTDGWNVTPWCDFRNFMDQTFADAVLRAANVCKAEDPHARCATEGGQSPFPFGWYNYEQVLRADDVIEPYNGGNNVEVIRSLKPETIMLSTVGYQYKAGEPLNDRKRLVQKQARRPVWWGLFHGHRGNIIWDNNLPDYRFVNPETGQLTPAAETYSAVFNELRRGIGKLFINAQRVHDGIAIHYSPPSDQIHWLLDNFQYARQWMLHNGSDRHSHAIAVRNSWTKLIEDLGMQYDFASCAQIRAGKLKNGGYRVFVMPQSIAVGVEETNEIREFVRAGGLLIADCRAAQMNEHGRALERGALDDLFGISRAEGQRAGQTIRGVANERSLQLEGKPLQLRVGDERIATEQGKAFARSGGVPLVIVNHFGEGRAVFLNLEVGDYCYERLRANSSSSLPDLAEGVLALAEVRPRVRVLASDGKRLPGTEVVTFANGPVEHVAIFRNPQFDDGGWEDHPTMTAPGWAGTIDNSFLEKEADITIEWKTAKPTYDVRGRRELGTIATHKTTLSPWEPLVFTRSLQPIPHLQVRTPPQIRTGGALELTFANETAFPDGAFRVVRLDLETPAGQPYGFYARNLFLRSATHTERIPLAFNDPQGRWRARILDVMTGHSQEFHFEVS
jgi:hypothetical protein